MQSCYFGTPDLFEGCKSFHLPKGQKRNKFYHHINILEYQVLQLVNYNTLKIMLKWLFQKNTKRSPSFVLFFKERNLSCLQFPHLVNN